MGGLVGENVRKDKWFLADLRMVRDLADFLMVSPHLITSQRLVPGIGSLPLQLDGSFFPPYVLGCDRVARRAEGVLGNLEVVRLAAFDHGRHLLDGAPVGNAE